jgi:hypothetical protein
MSDLQDDAKRLHDLGYTSRAVHAKWVLDAFKTLYGHLTDQGVPLEDGNTDRGKHVDSSFYLNSDEWDEVAAAAQTIVNLASIIAVKRAEDLI